MELTSKQRAQLRGLANTIDTIVQVGKDGINENLVKQVDDALEAREIIKGRVLENSMLTAREACQELCVLTRSEPVQVIGTKFVLYRRSHTVPADKRIELVGTVVRKKTVKAEPAKAAKKPAAKPAAKKTVAAKPAAKKTTGGKPAARTAARTAGRPAARKTTKK